MPDLHLFMWQLTNYADKVDHVNKKKKMARLQRNLMIKRKWSK
jgi:hypothetical protein